MNLKTEEAAEDALRDAFPDASVHVAWRVGALAQMSVDNDSVVRGSFEDALAWLIAHRKAARIVAAAPAPVVAPLPEPAPVPVFVPEPAPDMRDVELAAARAEINFLRACVEELQKPPPEPEPEPAPENHFADLMLADETADDARARLSARLKELRHYLMAPEIRVNEDGSLGLTGDEQAELQDLERRQTLGRWLDA